MAREGCGAGIRLINGSSLLCFLFMSPPPLFLWCGNVFFHTIPMRATVGEARVSRSLGGSVACTERVRVEIPAQCCGQVKTELSTDVRG